MEKAEKKSGLEFELPYIYFGKRNGLEYFRPLPFELDDDEVTGIIELDTSFINLEQPYSRLLGIQHAWLREKEFVFISLYEFSIDDFNRKGYHAFSVFYPLKKHHIDFKNILTTLEQGLILSRKLKEKKIEVIFSPPKISAYFKIFNSVRYEPNTTLFVPITKEVEYDDVIKNILLSKVSHEKVFASFNEKIIELTEYPQQSLEEIEYFKDLNKESVTKKRFEDIYTEAFLKEFEAAKPKEKSIENNYTDYLKKLNDTENTNQEIKSESNAKDEIKHDKENITTSSEQGIGRFAKYSHKAFKNIKSKFKKSETPTHNELSTGVDLSKIFKSCLPWLLVLILSVLYCYDKCSFNTNNNHISENPPQQIEDPIGLNDDNDILDLPPDDIVDDPTLELDAYDPTLENNFNAAAKYYNKIINKDRNQYNYSKLNGFIAALKKMIQSPEVIDLLQKYEKHQATYYKYGLKKTTHKFEQYQVKTRSDGKPESGYDVATRYGISVNRLCRFNPTDIIVIHKDVKGTIVTTTWQKDENGDLPIIDIYYKPQK